MLGLDARQERSTEYFVRVVIDVAALERNGDLSFGAGLGLECNAHPSLLAESCRACRSPHNAFRLQTNSDRHTLICTSYVHERQREAHGLCSSQPLKSLTVLAMIENLEKSTNAVRAALLPYLYEFCLVGDHSVPCRIAARTPNIVTFAPKDLQEEYPNCGGNTTLRDNYRIFKSGSGDKVHGSGYTGPDQPSCFE